MDKEFKRYNSMLEKLNELNLKTIGFTFEYFMINKTKNTSNMKIVFECLECKKHFIRTYSNMIKPERRKVCPDCCKIKKKTTRFSIEEISKKVSEKGLKLLSTEYLGEDKPIRVMCSCGNTYETTYASIRNSGRTDGVCKCKECAKKYSRDYFRMSYKEVVDYFKENGCELISGENEYVNIFSTLTFVAKCGHVHTTTFQSFKNSKHKVCESCKRNLNKGENAYNWSGGYYDKEDTKFRHSLEYREWRKKVFERDEYTCKHCGCVDARLNAHHLDGYNWCEEGRIDVDNGITLCEDCHKEFHSVYGYKDNTIEQFKEFQSAQL